MRGRLPHVFILVLIGIAYLSGGFDFIERRLVDFRFELFHSQASDSLVIVEIDPGSLSEVGMWPWPRRFHADVLNNLFTAGAARVGMTVDLSSVSNEQDDALLERVLANTYGRVVLPTFVQGRNAQSGSYGLVSRMPIHRFRQHVSLASVNVFSMKPAGKPIVS